MFGRRGRGFRFCRWLLAQKIGDPERALFGCGPCGEMMYQLYKKQKDKSN
jgi:hypothetical protein